MCVLRRKWCVLWPLTPWEPWLEASETVELEVFNERIIKMAFYGRNLMSTLYTPLICTIFHLISFFSVWDLSISEIFSWRTWHAPARSIREYEGNYPRYQPLNGHLMRFQRVEICARVETESICKCHLILAVYSPGANEPLCFIYSRSWMLSPIRRSTLIET